MMNYRYIAKILVEAETPLRIGSGEEGINIDELVATDANGLPNIPGTTITGVLRHSFPEKVANEIFGFQNKNIGTGSRLIVSNANFVGKDGKVIDGLEVIDYTEKDQDKFYSYFKKMAIRDHAKINHFGSAEKHGKFDTQVVFKGCRFVFEIELKSSKEDEEIWNAIIHKLSSPLFRIGGGTRKGFGLLKVISMEQVFFNLQQDSNRYLNRSSRLTIPTQSEKFIPEQAEELIEYNLHLHADDFFMFSSGYGDSVVDAVSKKEKVIKWENGKPKFSEEMILIPATSIKGAISHRTAFHYNKLTHIFADQLDQDKPFEAYVGENNEAVKTLFGYSKDSKSAGKEGQRGRVMIKDVFLQKTENKRFNHVALDSFTGSFIDGALFNEEANYTAEPILISIEVEKEALSDRTIKNAFENTLKDIASGMLPLGGNVMKGFGCFNGIVTIDGREL
jgi:CRISPR/Cas system CSM-associated protein Csm3 (group 7 of RAMP superfamily)